MSSREYAISQINTLPDGIVEKIQDFMEYQKFN